MTTSYVPKHTGPFTEDDRDQLQTTLATNHYTHLQTTGGDTYPLRYKSGQLNKKSVPVTAPGPSKTIPFTKVQSFGVMEDEEAGESGENMPDNIPAHADRDHALLSASGANRWLNCTPSPLLEEQYPDSSSDAAEEGTAAHELAEYKLRTLAGLEAGNRPTSEWHTEEMESHTDDYADHVMATLAQAQEHSPAAFLAIEQRLDFSHLVPDGFGTGDATIISDDELVAIDFKYGKGVEVTAENNPQMRLYALGALRQFGMIYNIQRVKTIIFQPRLSNISVEEITVDELTEWGEQVVKPQAAKATNGEGELAPGEWCRFCRHAPQCPALATHYFDTIPTTQPLTPAAPAPDTLSDEQISTIVTHAGDMKKWLTQVEKHALEQANTGHAYPGLKLVEGRSVRRYTDQDAVAKAVEDTGHDPWEHKLLGITAMTKLLGKKQFDETVGEYLHKPEGAPTLVPASDKRPALSVAKPDNVFTQIDKDTA